MGLISLRNVEHWFKSRCIFCECLQFESLCCGNNSWHANMLQEYVELTLYLSQSLPARQWKVDFYYFFIQIFIQIIIFLQNIFVLFSFILGLSCFLRHVHPSRTGWLCCHFYGLPKSLQSQSAPQTMYKCVKGFPHPSLPEQSKPRIKIMECNLQAAELNHWAPKA